MNNLSDFEIIFAPGEEESVSVSPQPLLTNVNQDIPEVKINQDIPEVKFNQDIPEKKYSCWKKLLPLISKFLCYANAS